MATIIDEKVWDSPNYKFEKGKCRVFIYSQPKLAMDKEDKFSKTRTNNKNRIEDADYAYLLNFFETSGLGKTENGNLKLKINTSMETVLADIEKFDKSAVAREYDCFFFIFLTYSWASTEHATLDGMKNLYVDERIQFSTSPEDNTKIPLSMKEIYKKVKGCSSMVTKPKIFLIQADDVRYMKNEVSLLGPDIPQYESMKIPSDADILTISSTIPQRFGADVKLTKEQSPSFLIKAFVDTLTENKSNDFITLTTLINGKVNKMINSNISKLNDKYKDKALVTATNLELPVPLVTSTLSKLLYLQ